MTTAGLTLKSSLQRAAFEDLFLIVDEVGTIIALVLDRARAQVAADALAAHVEATHSAFWHVGEHLPIFHD